MFVRDSVDSLVVLGIDPGLTRCGYAVLTRSGSGVSATLLGVMSTPPDLEVPERLRMLAADVSEVFDEAQPTSVAMERLFFQSNAHSAMSVAQSSALILLAAAQRNLPIAQYTPSQVKLAVTGSGTAEKVHVQRMVQRRLGLSRPPQPADAADAAAIALCHLAAEPLRRAVGVSR